MTLIFFEMLLGFASFIEAKSILVPPDSVRFCTVPSVLVVEITLVEPKYLSVVFHKNKYHNEYTVHYGRAEYKVIERLKMKGNQPNEFLFWNGSENDPMNFGDKPVLPVVGQKGVLFTENSAPFSGAPVVDLTFNFEPLDTLKKWKNVTSNSKCDLTKSK